MIFPKATRFPGVANWLGNNGLEIVLIILGAILLTRFATWFKAMVNERIDASDLE